MIAYKPPRCILAGFACLVVACGATAPSAGQNPPTVFQYDRHAALSVETSLVSESGGVKSYLISYASPGGGRVTGRLAIPAGAARKPAVILLHGLPGDAAGAMSFLGLDLASRGAVALAIDAPWVRRQGLPEFTTRDSVEQVQLMQDLQRAVDLLLTRDDVDPARIGYIGGSYGGAMGAAFVGIESRLRASILFVPDGGLVAHFTDRDGTPRGPLADISTAQQSRWLAAMRPIEPIRFVGGSSPAPLMIQNGRSDPLVTVEDAEALHAAAGNPKEVLWYDAGHNLGSLAAARADRARFLSEHLGIPLPP